MSQCSICGAPILSNEPVEGQPCLDCFTETNACATFYGAQCKSYPDCAGGCGLGCTHDMDLPASGAPLHAASLTERLIQAAVDYESGRCSKRELSEARKAVETAIDRSAFLSADLPQSLNVSMAQFVKWAMQEGPWSGCELDGADVQDKARKLGLLVKTQYDPEIHGESEFDVEPGDDWYVLAPEITSALSRPNCGGDK